LQFLTGPVCLLWLAVGLPAPGQEAAKWPLLSEWNFEGGSAEGWRPNNPSHWRVVAKEGTMVYEQAAPGEQGKIRAPTSWSVWTGHDVTSFEFTGRMQCYTDPAVPGRDMCVFFHFQDPAHFYYVHFSAESADVHNIIGLVNGADRVKINVEPAGTSAARMTDRAWHEFKVTYEARSGEIRAYLDDMTRPVLTARDRTLSHGLVGVGSFDDTGCFDDLRLRGLSRPERP
jgi:hypothetical protein